MASTINREGYSTAPLDSRRRLTCVAARHTGNGSLPIFSFAQHSTTSLRTGSLLTVVHRKETLLLLGLRRLRRIIATTSKICAVAASTADRSPPSAAATRPPTYKSASANTSSPSIFGPAEFHRYVATRFLPDADFHGHRPIVFIHLNPFVCCVVWCLIVLPGSFLFASPAYQKSPTTLAQVLQRSQCTAALAPSQFVDRIAAKPPLLYRASLRSRAVLKHISGGTSYQTVRLVFRPYAPLLPSICTSEPRTASSCLSSAFTDARHSSLVYRVAHPPLFRLRCATELLALQLAVHVLSLVRVSRRGCSKQLPAQFHFFSLFLLRSHYFSTIGLGVYLALDGRCHPFTVQYQTLLLLSSVVYGAVTLSGWSFQTIIYDSV